LRGEHDRDDHTAQAGETQPLTAYAEPLARDYGTESSGSALQFPVAKPKVSFVSRFNPMRMRNKKPSSKFLLPVDIVSEDAALHGLARKKPRPNNDGPDAVDDNEGEYLKSKLW